MRFQFPKFKKPALDQESLGISRLTVNKAYQELRVLYDQSKNNTDPLEFIKIPKRTIELTQFLIESFLKPSANGGLIKLAGAGLLNHPDRLPSSLKESLHITSQALKEIDNSLDELQEIAIQILPGDSDRLKVLSGSSLMNRPCSEVIESLGKRTQLFTAQYDFFKGLYACTGKAYSTFSLAKEITRDNKDKLEPGSFLDLLQIKTGLMYLAHICSGYPHQNPFELRALANSTNPELSDVQIQSNMKDIKIRSEELSKMSLDECHAEIDRALKHLQLKLIHPMSALLFSEDPILNDHRRGLTSFHFYSQQLTTSASNLIDMAHSLLNSPQEDTAGSDMFLVLQYELAQYEITRDSLQLICMAYLNTLYSQIKHLRTMTNSINPRMETLVEIESELPGIYDAFASAIETAQGIKYFSDTTATRVLINRLLRPRHNNN
jgi:hypothetical protein